MADFLKIADRSWPVLGRLFRAHAVLYRATGGRLGARLPGRPPTLLLDHIGARSGKPRTTPLIYMPVEDNFLIVAAKGATRKIRRGYTTCVPTPTPRSRFERTASRCTPGKLTPTNARDYGRSPPATTQTGVTISAALRGRSRW